MRRKIKGPEGLTTSLWGGPRAKWPDEPLLHHIRARIALDVPEANLQSVPLAEKNFLYNPRSVSTRLLLLRAALDSHAKHRRDDIERLCREPHAEGVALEQETLPELEEVVGTKGSLVQARGCSAGGEDYAGAWHSPFVTRVE